MLGGGLSVGLGVRKVLGSSPPLNNCMVLGITVNVSGSVCSNAQCRGWTESSQGPLPGHGSSSGGGGDTKRCGINNRATSHCILNPEKTR